MAETPAETFAALVPTPLGPAALLWGEAGLAGTQLPGTDAAATRAALRRRWPAAREAPLPPGWQGLADGIARLLAGAPADFADAPLDWSRASPGDRAVLEEARRIPRGETSTYGAIAASLGDPALARAVGAALGRNPWPVVVPCHRVLAAHGRPGGFSAPGGAATKLRLLALEGAFRDRPALPFDDLPHLPPLRKGAS